MSNGDFRITEEQFKNMKPEDRDWMLFNTFNVYRDACEQRFRNIEKKQKVESVLRIGVSAISGFVGGFTAMIMKFLGK